MVGIYRWYICQCHHRSTILRGDRGLPIGNLAVYRLAWQVMEYSNPDHGASNLYRHYDPAPQHVCGDQFFQGELTIFNKLHEDHPSELCVEYVPGVANLSHRKRSG